MLPNTFTATSNEVFTKRIQRPMSSVYRSSGSNAQELVEFSVQHETTPSGIVNSALIIDNTRILTDASNLGKPERVRLTFKLSYKDLSIRDDRDAEIAAMISVLGDILADTTFKAGFLAQEA